MENEKITCLYEFPKIKMEDDNNSVQASAQKEILLQLHQQFAENSNASLNTIISMVASLIAIFGAYGYVYIHTGCEAASCFHQKFENSDGTYFVDALVLTSICAAFVLSVLAYICISVGMGHRKEQFIINAIREHYFEFEYSGDKGKRIFPSGYHPFFKDNCNVILGVFGDLVKVFTIAGAILVVSFLFKIPWCLLPEHCLTSAEVFVAIIVFAVAFMAPYCKFDHQVKQYKKYQEDYFGKHIVDEGQLNNNEITIKPEVLPSYFVLKIIPEGRIDDEYIITDCAPEIFSESKKNFNETIIMKFNKGTAIYNQIITDGLKLCFDNAKKVRVELHSLFRI